MIVGGFSPEPATHCLEIYHLRECLQRVEYMRELHVYFGMDSQFYNFLEDEHQLPRTLDTTYMVVPTSDGKTETFVNYHGFDHSLRSFLKTAMGTEATSESFGQYLYLLRTLTRV